MALHQAPMLGDAERGKTCLHLSSGSPSRENDRFTNHSDEDKGHQCISGELRPSGHTTCALEDYGLTGARVSQSLC